MRIWTGGNGSKLIASGGTLAGTAVVATLPGASFQLQGGRGTGVGNRLLDSTKDLAATTVWSTDGTPGGTQALATTPNASSLGSLAWMYQVQDKALFAFHASTAPAASAQVYVSDGTAAGTQLVQTAVGMGSGSTAIATATGVLYGATSSVAFGEEPHFSDGTSTGTVQLVELHPGPNSSAMTAAGSWNGRAFFTASAPATGTELYVTDGTAAGTTLAADLAAAAASSTFGATCWFRSRRIPFATRALFES